MNYQFLVVLIALTHLAFVLFVFFGAALVLRWRWVVWLHIPAGLWATVIELGGFVCPLTWAELQFRHAAGLSTYYGGFIVHYILTPLNAPPEVQQSMGFIVLAINLALYAVVIAAAIRKGQLKRASMELGGDFLSSSMATGQNA